MALQWVAASGTKSLKKFIFLPPGGRAGRRGGGGQKAAHLRGCGAAGREGGSGAQAADLRPQSHPWPSLTQLPQGKTFSVGCHTNRFLEFRKW